MAFILSAERDVEYAQMLANYARYAEYLRANEATFPASAHALATSAGSTAPRIRVRRTTRGWREVRIVERPESEPAGPRTVDIHVRLLNAYHTGRIELHYTRVTSYDLGMGMWVGDIVTGGTTSSA